MLLRLEADDEHRSFGIGDDGEEDERGAIGGQQNQQMRRCTGHEFPRGAGADQKAPLASFLIDDVVITEAPATK